MTLSSSFLTLLRRTTLPASRHRHLPRGSRFLSGDSDARPHKCFTDIGISKGLQYGLHIAFPNVKYPTQAQCEFIPAILRGRDVILKDKTGSGKSFGLVLALLSHPRLFMYVPIAGKYEQRPVISSLVICPHRDLAFQYQHWINSIYSSMHRAAKPDTMVQVVVRSEDNPLADQIAKLVEDPPNIVVGTPQALLEVFQEKRELFRNLSTVVVDEIDYLVETLPSKRDNYALLKLERQIKSHPTPTRQILDALYLPRHSPIARKYEQDDTQAKKAALAAPTEEQFGVRRPQLVVTSATLRSRTRSSLRIGGGWFTKREGQLCYVSGPSSDDLKPDADAVLTIGGTGVVHHALVVSDDGKITNIKGAARADASEPGTSEENPNDFSYLLGKTVSLPDPPEVNEAEAKYTLSNPFNIPALEAIATAFALDVPRVALLVLPASAPVRRAIYIMQKLGVNAYGLDVLNEKSGGAFLLQKGTEVPEANPTLLISTLATTRGLDLPDLTHVFMLGVPEAESTDTYLHVAGRVGRFGRGGKVISVLESARRIPIKKGKVGVKDEPTWMARIYKRIGVRPTAFEHFD